MGLTHVFGNKPIPRIMDFLMVHRDWDYPLSQIEQATGVSYRTLQSVVPELVGYGVMVETRIVGKAKFYQLNWNSPAIMKLAEFSTSADLEFFKHASKKKVAAAIRN